MNLDDILMGLRNQKLQQRQPTTRRQTAAPAQANLPSPTRRMPGQDAVDFGRSFTGGAGPGADAVDKMSRDVFARLSTKGLYKDGSGSWQIRGMERPDVTRGIRDSAVSAMGGPDWSRIVGQGDQRAAGPASGMPAGSGNGVPSPGLGGVPAVPKQSADPYGVGSKLSGLGRSISSGVKNQVGGIQSTVAGKAPPTGSIQSVVEQSLRSRGQQPPTSGPLTAPQPGIGGVPQRTAQGDWPTGNSGAPPIPTQGGGLQTPTQANVAAGNLQPTGGRPGSAIPGQIPQPGLGGVPQPSTQPSTTPAPSVTGSGMGVAASPSGYSTGVGAPQGTIQTSIGYGNGGDWAAVNQYDAAFTQYGNQYGVDPAMLKAMAVIESGGQMIQGPGGAYGVMQIKPEIWGQQAAQMGYDLNTPEGQIGFAAAFLGGAVPGVAGNTPEERFLNAYYPTDCLDCAPVDGNGITQRMYLDSVNQLVATINGANPSGGAPQGTPQGNVPISQGQLNAIGAGSGGVPQSVPPVGDPRLSGIGAGSGANINHAGGIPGSIDPATGKFVPLDPNARQDIAATGGNVVPASGNTIASPNGGTSPAIVLPPAGQIPHLTGVGDVGHQVAQIAQLYVGQVGYEEASVFDGTVPGVDPRGAENANQWDCSGLTYYMDHTYGQGQLPAGSYPQYAYARDNGLLQTDPSTLKEGDIVFLNTDPNKSRCGDCGNGCCEDGNYSSHVGIYVGGGKIVAAAQPCGGGLTNGVDCGTIVDDLSNYSYLGHATIF